MPQVLDACIVLCLSAAVAGCAAPGVDEDDEMAMQSFASEWNPCEGQPDGAQPPGCDHQGKCIISACTGEVCGTIELTGAPCDPAGVCPFGTCNAGACESECPSCQADCDRQLEDCKWTCGDSAFCDCICTNQWKWCMDFCGKPQGPGEICVTPFAD